MEDTRLAELQASANARGAGTVWSKDEKGNYVVTNTPSTRGEITAVDQFKQKMKEIESLPLEDRINALISLQGSAAEYISKRRQDIISLAEAELGVPQLKAALEENIRLDRETPSYFSKYGTADSDETAAVRRQYQSALAAASALAEKRIAADPEINKLASELESFLKFQAAFINDKTKELEKAREFSEGIRWVAKVVYDDDSLDTIQKNFKELSTLYQYAKNPVELINLVSEGKIPASATLMAHLQASSNAGTSDMSSPEYQAELDKAKRDIQLFQAIALNETTFKEVFKATRPNEREVSKVTSLTGQDYADYKKSFALKYMQNKVTQEFLENVDSWKVTTKDGIKTNPFADENSPLGQAYRIAKRTNGKVSLQSLIGAIQSLPDNKMKAAALDSLKQAAENARSHASKSYFWPMIDMLNLDSIINLTIAQSVYPSLSDIFSLANPAYMAYLAFQNSIKGEQ